MAIVQSLYWLAMLVGPPLLPAPAATASRSDAALPRAVADLLDPVPSSAHQVRIEQRIIIRVPRQSIARSSLAPMPAPRRVDPPEPLRFERRKVGKCVVMRDVTGVRVIDDDNLVLFMRDRRLIEAELERSCSAREFFQGFYMERSRDGRLCIDRDMIQARSGSKCEVERLRELVPED